MATNLLTVEEISVRLNCSVSFVYKILNSGRLKYYGLGKGQGGERCSEAQVQAYLDSVERGGETIDENEKLEFIR